MTSEVTPAGIPPQGVEPNFINPRSLYPHMLVTVVLCSSLTTILTSARLFTRWMTSAWALEDHLLMLAWAFNMAYDYIFLVSGQVGAGRHLWDVRAVDTVNIAKFSWILSTVYCPTTWLAKGAVLFQLMHIFAPTRTGLIYWACHALIWGNLAFYTSAFFTTIFQCIPQDKIWNPEHEGGHCINFNVAYAATGAVNVLSDFLILLLPLLGIWRLHLAPKRKLGISAVFATGFIAFASSICRLAYTTKFFTGRDTTYFPAQVGMWTLAEIATIILCTCFPVMPRFAQLMLSEISQSRDTESDPSYPGGRNISGGGGTPLGLRLPDRSEAWIKRGDAMAPPKNAYIPLEEHEYKKASGQYSSAGHSGIQRTVSIELTSYV